MCHVSEKVREKGPDDAPRRRMAEPKQAETCAVQLKIEMKKTLRMVGGGK